MTQIRNGVSAQKLRFSKAAMQQASRQAAFAPPPPEHAKTPEPDDSGATAPPIIASRLELIAETPQKLLTRRDLLRPLDALRLEAIDHAEDAAALLRLGDDHLGGVGRSAED